MGLSVPDEGAANIEAGSDSVKRGRMKFSFFSSAALFVVWVLLAFVVAIPSGWVHLPLAGAAILVARGIALGGPAAPPDQGAP